MLRKHQAAPEVPVETDGLGRSEPLRRGVRARVVRALTPVAELGGKRRLPPLRALVGSGRGRRFVSLRRIQPRIPESEKKLARVPVGGLLRACRALRGFLPAISDLFLHDGFRPGAGCALDLPAGAEFGEGSKVTTPEECIRFQCVGWAKRYVPTHKSSVMPAKTRVGTAPLPTLALFRASPRNFRRPALAGWKPNAPPRVLSCRGNKHRVRSMKEE